MDYIKTPKTFIYKHRNDLNDFGVQTPGTINHYLFSQMRRMTLLRTGHAKKIALQCFNNAYYICTLIQLEQFPDLCIDEYEQKLFEVRNVPFPEDVCAASMGLVCKLLPAYDAQWKQEDNLLIESIRHHFSHGKWMNSYSRVSFENIVGECNTDGFFLPKSEFAPRDIVEAIEDIDRDEAYILEHSVEYICERLALMDDPRRRTYGADLAIARLNDSLRDTYKDYGYNPKTKSFEPAEPGTFGAEPDFEECFWKEVNPIKEAIKYIKEHYPTNKDDDSKEKSNKQEKNKQQETSPSQTAIEETPALQAKISQQTKYIKELKAEIENLRNQLDQKQSTQADWYEGEFESLPAETEFVLRERVVFFATVLSLDFNKKYTVLANLAAFIEALCNDQHSVAPFITKMKRDSEAAANAKAAKKVAGLLKAIIPDEYKQDEKLKINKIIESMKANFPEKEE